MLLDDVGCRWMPHPSHSGAADTTCSLTSIEEIGGGEPLDVGCWMSLDVAGCRWMLDWISNIQHHPTTSNNTQRHPATSNNTQRHSSAPNDILYRIRRHPTTSITAPDDIQRHYIPPASPQGICPMSGRYWWGTLLPDQSRMTPFFEMGWAG